MPVPACSLSMQFLEAVLAVLVQLDQFVQGGVVPLAEQAAVRDGRRRAVHQGGLEQRGQIFHPVPFIDDSLQIRARTSKSSALIKVIP